MEKLPIKDFLHTAEESLQKIHSQLEILEASANLSERDAAALNIALKETRSLVVLSASPIEQMKREEIRLSHSIVTHFEANNESGECAIKDVSSGGALIWFDQDIEKGNKISVNFPEVGLVDCTVIGTTTSGTHIEFDGLSKEKSNVILETAFSREH